MSNYISRGKREDNGEWVYGDLIHGKGEQKGHLFIWYETDTFPFVEEAEVIPETIGYYTLLSDKNGTKIFDGDILEGDLDDSLDLGAKWRSAVVMGKFGWMADNPTGSAPTPLDEFDIEEGEVIGNIHDNPKLLEVAENE